MNPSGTIARFQEACHWNEITRSSPDAFWIEETGSELEEVLEETWEKIPPGGFLGGPLWGCGPDGSGGWAFDTRSPIEAFRTRNSDVSELFLGAWHRPCWMVYKREPYQERVLLISGCDELQMIFFGEQTQRNHEYYAGYHGYETQWHLWNPEQWGSTREELVWAKLKVVADALETGQWDQVWWVDADAAVMNIERNLDHFLHPSWDAVFPEFEREKRVMLSTGVFGCRPAAEPLLRYVWEKGMRENLPCEEDALADAVQDRPELWKDVQLVNHDLFNGVYGWNINFSDPERAFICHLVSRSNRERRKVFKLLNRAIGI